MFTKERLKEALAPLFSSKEITKIFLDSKAFLKNNSWLCDLGSTEYEDEEVLKYLLKRSGTRECAYKERMAYSYYLEKRIPLVLDYMEKEGIKVERLRLLELVAVLEKEIARLEEEVYAEAGERFNVNSPKQVNEVLFGKMGLKGSKKTEGGGLSTRASVLEELAEGGSKIAGLMTEIRHVYKIKNTYADSLLEILGSSKTGRIHTTFSSTSTLTGRLNSRNPNLQNLPARGKFAYAVKSCFVAEAGYSLISFDYSQIELRILSFIADVKQLKEAFHNGADIHRSTAAVVFDKPFEAVSDEERGRAKAINFGIIYGVGGFALGKSLGISTSEANKLIEWYLQKYSGIKKYMEETISQARKSGYVRTLFGKKCYLEGIDSSNFAVRSHAERAGVNAKIQGTAADLMKKAMLDIWQKHGLLGEDCRMLLQIHDELIFEVKNEHLEEKKREIGLIMKQVWDIEVPLLVSISGFYDD